MHMVVALPLLGMSALTAACPDGCCGPLTANVDIATIAANLGDRDATLVM